MKGSGLVLPWLKGRKEEREGGHQHSSPFTLNHQGETLKRKERKRKEERAEKELERREHESLRK